ncbi:MAG: Plasminogen [Parcubacteria group bacterium GW2011_GWF2_40_10]|nr:MAG: Plasminogen [Parcubacteria group bacterium GW2011_GWF2_40_10]
MLAGLFEKHGALYILGRINRILRTGNENSGGRVAISQRRITGGRILWLGFASQVQFVGGFSNHDPEGCTSATGFSPTTGQSCATTTTTYPEGCTSATGFSSTTGQSCSSVITTVPTGTGLAVASPTQPVATLAPESAARVPFTKVTLTAGADDVTVTGINIERTNLGSDSNFSGIVLLDENDTQLGLEKTLNSNHQATVGDTFTVKAGTSKTMTIAGNMAADNSTRAGQIVALTINGINTSATVSGILPITGAVHTINATLSIGSVPTLAVGSIDPGSGQNKEVGTTGYTFSSVKFTTGSAEKVRFNSIRWNQSGSAATSDIENVKTYIDGVAYDTTVSSDGKYYTSTFGSGIVVDKGGSIEMSIKGDIVSGSGRTIDFDIYKRTDVNVVGETYGYGITPANGATDPTDDTGAFSSANPWFDAYQATVSTGSLTITKATSVSAQNIAENVSDVTLGGFEIEAKGEAISVAQQVYHFQITSTAGQVEDITNIALFDSNGNIVAGPADGSGAAVYGTVTFTDTVTFPIGKGTYTLKGKLGTDFANNQTVVASTTPSSDFTSITGQTTGNSITPSSAVVTGNTMTVKAAALAISVSTNPAAQTVVAGAQEFTFANYIFDATASGEDVKINSFPFAYEKFGNTATNLNNCVLYDGSTALNTGSNVLSPTSSSASSTTFTLDNPLTISKGTAKTISLKCNIVAGATGTYAWGYDSEALPTVTGVTSGQSAALTENDSTGQAMALTANGTLTVTENTSQSPAANAVAASGSTVTLGVIDFTSANEAIELTYLGLTLTNTASSSVSDLSQVTLWDGSTQVGTLILTGSTGTSTILTNTDGTSKFIIGKDETKSMTVKADLAAIGTSQVGTQGALIAVDYIGAGNAQGRGSSSGTTITSTSGATSFSGVRMFKTFPTVVRLSGIESSLSGTTDETIMGFSITADSAGKMSLYKLSFNIATTGVTADSLNVYAYDSYSNGSFTGPISGINSGGKLMNTDVDLEANWASASTDLEIYPQISTASTTIEIPAGATRYFKVVATITGVSSGDSLTVTLKGDNAYPSLAGLVDNYVNIEAAATAANNFIWSPRATTTTNSINDYDWINGYNVTSLPSGGISYTKSK